MQKFIVIKKAQSPPKPPQNAEPKTQIKFCGYLKKKRNRVGGWRKMYFVLQNQLLLSYSSQEDYEKKLAPLKDVINMLPGTSIIPVQNTRFIIETTTKTLYSFRCDDPKTCSKWITALLESLNCDKSTEKASNAHQKPKTKPSPMSQPSKGNQTPSRAPLNPLARPKSRRKSPARLPIADSTARFLKHSEKSMPNPANSSEQLRRNRDFRLHDALSRQQRGASESQSSAVSRINSMFDRRSDSTRPSPPPAAAAKTSIVLASNSSGNGNGGGGGALAEIRSSMKKFIVTRTKTNAATCAMDLNQNMNSIGTPTTTDRDAANNVEEQVQEICLEEEMMSDKEEMQETEELEAANALAAIGGALEKTAEREPIYAVVNLESKHAKRAKRSRTDLMTDEITPFSCDYEEVQNFPAASTESSDNENIYEPIEIPEAAQHSLWTQFRKMNLEKFHEFSRKMREIRPKKSENGSTTTNDQPTDKTSSALTEFGRKLGQHRRSIKNRVKKFYTRDESNATKSDISPCSSVSQSSAREMGATPPKHSFVVNEILKYKRGEKQLFGTFARVKKSRTSMFFEEFVPTKKAPKIEEVVEATTATAPEKSQE